MIVGRWVFPALVFLLGACASQRVQAGPPKIDLAGNWKLDEAASDTAAPRDPAENTRFNMRGRIGAPGRPMPGGVNDLGDAQAELRDVVQALNRGRGTINIAQTDSATTITFADTTSLYLRNDGSSIRVFWRGVGDVDASGRWKGNTFIVERKLERGMLVRESFSRAPGSSQLLIETVIDPSPLREMKYRRVYDASAGK